MRFTQMFAVLWAMSLLPVSTVSAAPAQEADPAEVSVGERLFLETRFAQFFLTHSGGDANATLISGDPVLDSVTTTNGIPLTNPFVGQSMNCRACHFVDELGLQPGGGNRTYSDFARRSPIPQREDGHLTTPRNSPALVNSALPRRKTFLLHFDGEFATTADLVKGTFTGRNFGWLPQEQKLAKKHIADIIRKDNGKGALAGDFGNIPYRTLLSGGPGVPEELALTGKFTVNVYTATDDAIFDAVAKLVAAYVDSLLFSQDNRGDFNASPYDVFLRKNKLPRHPENREADIAYARRLRSLLESLPNPQFVTDSDGAFQFHEQPFVFGTNELAGLMIFLSEPATLPPSPEEISSARIGNCIACHAPPNFTDFRFHNTGIAQNEYDTIHGAGAFQQLPIPTLTERLADYDAYLPPTAAHPNATGRFLAVPTGSDPSLTDLGVWNVFANPEHKKSQSKIRRILIEMFGPLPPDQMLDKTIAAFKTPGLRDLADSAPYFHNGQFDSLAAVVGFYRGIGDAARSGTVRNADPQLNGIALSPEAVSSVVAFLRSLTEDYN